jgi:hypothetical protein
VVEASRAKSGWSKRVMVKQMYSNRETVVIAGDDMVFIHLCKAAKAWAAMPPKKTVAIVGRWCEFGVGKGWQRGNGRRGEHRKP